MRLLGNAFRESELLQRLEERLRARGLWHEPEKQILHGRSRYAARSKRIVSSLELLDLRRNMKIHRTLNRRAVFFLVFLPASLRLQ